MILFWKKLSTFATELSLAHIRSLREMLASDVAKGVFMQSWRLNYHRS